MQLRTSVHFGLKHSENATASCLTTLSSAEEREEEKVKWREVGCRS